MLAVKEEKGSINYEKYVEEMGSIFDDYKIVENRELIAKKLWNLHSRKTFRMQGIDVEDIDFEIIRATNPLEWMIRYTSDTCNINTLDRFREALRDANEKRWNKSFEILKSHFEKTNSAVISQNLTVDGINLFNFATVQRKAFKKGKMSRERQSKLESLPFWYWDFSDSREDEGKTALMAFISHKGHPRVPSTHVENGFRLGGWINQKKVAYHNKELPNGEINFFESLPEWTWSIGNDQLWEYGFSILEKYVQIHENAQPPSGYRLEGFSVATWVKGQRQAYLEGSLPRDKAERLSKLPGWSWRVFDDKNKAGFNALDLFVKREGHALVPGNHIENGFKLGKWVTVKRLAASNPRSKHTLTEEHRKKLESYPWWFWNGDDGRWEWGQDTCKVA
jgi:hypothetical protein